MEVSKKVVFAGVWRSQTINDQLLRQIGNQNSKKRKHLKGNQAVLNLSNERLDVLIYDDKGNLERTDQVPLPDIVELSANKYVATSIFAIVRDNVHKQFYIFVFHCASDKDAGDIIQGYSRVKQRLSGEGFNTNIKAEGANWTLQQKQDQESEHTTNGHVTIAEIKPTQNGDVRIISTERVEGETRIVTHGVKASEPPTTGDETPVTEAEMKEELHHLAGEIRDIKAALYKSRGRQNFEKHYQYLMQGKPATKTHVIRAADAVDAKPQQYVYVEGNPPEEQHEIKYRLGSTTVQRPVSNVQYRNTVVQPSLSKSYRTTVVQPSTPVQQYRSTIVQPAHVQTIRATAVHQAPHIKHYTSNRSRASSIQSGYTKHTYDSPTPVLVQSRRYVKNQPKIVTKSHEHVVEQKPVSKNLVIVSPSDKVTKRIENVYKNRSHRMHVRPSMRPTAEYVVVDQQQQQPRSQVMFAQQSDDDKVKEYIEEKTTEGQIHQQVYEPEIRHIYENKDTLNEDVVVSERVITENQPTIVVTEDVTREEPVSVITENQPTVVVTENITREEPVQTVVKQEYTTTTVEHDQHGDEVIVIKADTNVYKSADEHIDIVRDRPVPENKVYYVKAEGLESANEAGNVIVQESRDTVIVRSEPPSGDGLFESYVENPDADALRDTIVSETTYRYHDDDSDNEERSETVVVRQEGKRVHYMAELEQTIADKRSDDEDDDDIKQELEEIQGRINGDDGDRTGDNDDDDDYVLNEEELAQFRMTPTIVVIDKED